MDKENDSSSAALVVHSVQDQSVDVDTSLEHSGQTQPESDQMQAGTAVATRGTSALHIRIAPIGNNPIQSSSSTTHEKEKTGADGDEEAVSDNSADEREEAVVERRRLDRERRQQQRNQLRDEAKKQAEEDAWKTAVRDTVIFNGKLQDERRLRSPFHLNPHTGIVQMARSYCLPQDRFRQLSAFEVKREQWRMLNFVNERKEMADRIATEWRQKLEFDFQPPEVPPGATLAELDRVGIGALFGVGSGGLAVVPKILRTPAPIRVAESTTPPVQEKEKDSVREKSEKESSPPQPAVQEEPVVEPVPTCAVCGMEEVDMRVPDNKEARKTDGSQNSDDEEFNGGLGVEKGEGGDAWDTATAEQTTVEDDQTQIKPLEKETDLIQCDGCALAQKVKNSREGKGRSKSHAEKWYCTTCKFCNKCKQSKPEDQLLICDACDEGIHTFCVSPPLSEPPKGRFLCDSCMKCQKCGTQKPGEQHHRWRDNYSLCQECHVRKWNQSFCPVCRFSWFDDEEEEDMVECDECGLWIHCACIHMSKSTLKKLGRDESSRFLCPRCEKGDEEEHKYRIDARNKPRLMEKRKQRILSKRKALKHPKPPEQVEEADPSSSVKVTVAKSTSRSKKEKASSSSSSSRASSTLSENKTSSVDEDSSLVAKEARKITVKRMAPSEPKKPSPRIVVKSAPTVGDTSSGRRSRRLSGIAEEIPLEVALEVTAPIKKTSSKVTVKVNPVVVVPEKEENVSGRVARRLRRMEKQETAAGGHPSKRRRGAEEEESNVAGTAGSTSSSVGQGRDRKRRRTGSGDKGAKTASIASSSSAKSRPTSSTRTQANNKGNNSNNKSKKEGGSRRRKTPLSARLFLGAADMVRDMMIVPLGDRRNRKAESAGDGSENKKKKGSQIDDSTTETETETDEEEMQNTKAPPFSSTGGKRESRSGSHAATQEKLKDKDKKKRSALEKGQEQMAENDQSPERKSNSDGCKRKASALSTEMEISPSSVAKTSPERQRRTRARRFG